MTFGSFLLSALAVLVLLGIGQRVLGGAGLFDTAVISGILAVLLCELAGELLERVARARSAQPKRQRVRIPMRRKNK